MKIDRSRFLSLVFALSAAPGLGCGGVRVVETEPAPRSSSGGAIVVAPGYREPSDGCTEYDSTGECIMWAAVAETPTYECTEWDSVGECVGWEGFGTSPTSECVDWDSTGECIGWAPAYE